MSRGASWFLQRVAWNARSAWGLMRKYISIGDREDVIYSPVSASFRNLIKMCLYRAKFGKPGEQIY